jgi:hypothetical protein
MKSTVAEHARQIAIASRQNRYQGILLERLPCQAVRCSEPVAAAVAALLKQPAEQMPATSPMRTPS